MLENLAECKIFSSVAVDIALICFCSTHHHYKVDSPPAPTYKTYFRYLFIHYLSAQFAFSQIETDLSSTYKHKFGTFSKSYDCFMQFE